MKAVVTGTDYIRGYDSFKTSLDKVFAEEMPTLIVCGMNNGADMLAKRYAKRNGIKSESIIDGVPLPNCLHNVRRNKAMLVDADLVIVFWSSTTFKLSNLLSLAMKRNIKTILFEIKKPGLTRGRKPAITKVTQTSEEN